MWCRNNYYYFPTPHILLLFIVHLWHLYRFIEQYACRLYVRCFDFQPRIQFLCKTKLFKLISKISYEFLLSNVSQPFDCLLAKSTKKVYSTAIAIVGPILSFKGGHWHEIVALICFEYSRTKLFLSLGKKMGRIVIVTIKRERPSSLPSTLSLALPSNERQVYYLSRITKSILGTK